ncbi:threonine synthase [Martiniozyma asiatica (nom. inval.)]|nr:threonine synthase [Martiniozyma asiatica]
MSQVYRSTRSAKEQAVTFEEAIITGLAKDGGLFIPSEIPKAPENFIESWSDLSFQDLAFNIMRMYIKQSEIPDEDLRQLVEKSYSTFRAENVTPLVKIDSKDNLHLLELFHGPTYAFKDVALQFVGNLFEYFLQRKNAAKKEGEERDIITVVGATSGDTGSAAIYGLRNKKDVSVFIMYPTGRVSPLQEEQMTTVTDDNIHTFSVKGTFDDCQSLVKQVFNDTEFNDKYHIGAVNSINWARILAQITYYFHSFFQLKKQVSGSDIHVKYVVPSGNFGDILAGFFAAEMGLPVDKFVVGTNENNILNRFLNTGKYDKDEVKVTYSPAMDICVSSNFERFLWYMIRKADGANDDNKTGAIMAEYMDQLSSSKGEFNVSSETLAACKQLMDSATVSNEETVATIKATYEETSNKYILDPHSAVGISTCLKKMAEGEDKPNTYYISLSTAHPAKFSEVVNEALGQFSGYSFENDVLPEELKKLSSMPKKIRLIETAELKTIENAIVEELAKEGKN